LIIKKKIFVLVETSHQAAMKFSLNTLSCLIIKKKIFVLVETSHQAAMKFSLNTFFL